MKQKLVRIGNSTGVIIPKVLLDNMKLSAGRSILLEEDLVNNFLVIRKENSTKTTFSPKFLKLLEDVNNNYKDALEKLA
ncbi:MAG: AbrB/MazE/SpoVT family DNA-binding domain-containing protein [Patescibacteria group bacterium]